MKNNDKTFSETSAECARMRENFSGHQILALKPTRSISANIRMTRSWLYGTGSWKQATLYIGYIGLIFTKCMKKTEGLTDLANAPRCTLKETESTF